MIVRVKLMGMLKERAPAKDTMELAEGATVREMLEALDIGTATIQAVTVNGSIERDLGRSLASEDEVVVLPPVGGG